MSPLGRYPTPVEPVAALSAVGTELWIKRDDRTHPGYGGNKVRKLEHLLGDAKCKGIERVVTVGAAGSHHVLATTYFGQELGIEVEAVLVAQPRTPHVVDVLRAAMGLGLRPFPVGSWGAVPFALARRVASGAHFIAMGGSSARGSLGYLTAARELAAQVRGGDLPEPDVCVVAVGSGGTAAGLTVGFEAEGLRTRVVGVCIATPTWALRLASLWLARACARRSRVPTTLAAIQARLRLDNRFLGAGYGWSTPEGDEATALAREHAGLVLDPTYTAKTFAAALWQVRARQAERVLYWHTLSSAPLGALLDEAPSEAQMPEGLRALVRSSGAMKAR